jgi:hypothetical protein
MRQELRLALLLALILTTASGADQEKDKPASEPKSIDTTLYHTLRDVINRGVKLYNGGEVGACYRLFEGSLRTIKPLLDHKPDLQKMITTSLEGAEQDPVMWRRAFTLRNALDKVRKELDPNKEKDKLPMPKTDEKKDDKKDDLKDKEKEKEKEKEKDKDKDDKKDKKDDGDTKELRST